MSVTLRHHAAVTLRRIRSFRDKTWNFSKEDDKVYFLTVRGLRAEDFKTKKQLECIEEIQRGRTADELLIKFKNTTNGRRVLRSKFDGAEEFGINNESNRTFIDSFKRLMGEDPTSRKRSSARMELIQPEDTPPQKKHQGDVEEVLLKFVGEYKFSLQQLVVPPNEYLLRELNTDWVSKISTDMLYTTLVSTIIPVMIDPQQVPDKDSFNSALVKDYKAWTLGGNHVTQALKAVHPQMDILCQVYIALSPEEAVRVACIHNKKQQGKPLTFQDKVKLARRMKNNGLDEEGKLGTHLRNYLGQLEMREINDSFSTIVSVARYSEDCYSLFLQIAEAAEKTNGKDSIPQKLFRLLQAETGETCTSVLKEALENGISKASRWLEEGKRREGLKRIFMTETECTSWEDAEEKFPTAAQKVVEFKDIKGKTYVPEKFLQLCREAKTSSSAEEQHVDVKIQIKYGNKDISDNSDVKKIIADFEHKISQECRKVNFIQEE